jgi:large subunit ribosomal protein L18
MSNRKIKRKIRHLRLRKKIRGTSERPRLVVFKSNRHIYAQIINDDENKILVAVHSLKIKPKKSSKATTEKNKKILMAFEVGKALAKLALAKGIKKVVFDRGGWPYHGRIKALAEGAREGGLIF